MQHFPAFLFLFGLIVVGIILLSNAICKKYENPHGEWVKVIRGTPGVEDDQSYTSEDNLSHRGPGLGLIETFSATHINHDFGIDTSRSSDPFGFDK